jgi:hypothetical protein
MKRDKRVEAVAWVTIHDGAMLCLVGAEEQIAELPPVKPKPEPVVPPIGKVYVVYNDYGGYEGCGEPLGVYTSRELAEAGITDKSYSTIDEMDLVGKLEDFK